MPKETPAAAVENAGSASQRLISATLGTLTARCEEEKLKSPAVVVVGEVVSFAPQFSWKKFLPLSVRKIIVTRPRERAGKLSAMLRAKGAEVVEIPCIKNRRIEAELPDFSNYDWIGFTSITGVESLFALLAETGRDVRSLGPAKIAAIGSATANALKERGLITDYVPEIYDGVHLARGVRERVNGGRFLIIRAKDGSPELTEEFAKLKINFTELPLYETIYEKPDIIPRGADTAVFTSASTVRGFKASMPNLKIETACCIGAQTEAEAKRIGNFERIITAREATLSGLVNILEEDMK